MISGGNRGVTKSRVGPDFLCIGAQKAGTSWLYDMLVGHPDVVMPPVKEIHFFDEAESSCSTNFIERIRNVDDVRNRRWWRIAKLSLPKALLSGRFRKFGWLVSYLCSSRRLDSKGLSVYNNFFASVPVEMLTGDVTPYYALLQPGTIATISANYPNLKIIYLLRNPFERAMSALRMYVRDTGITSASDLSDDFVVSYGMENQHTRYIENLNNWLEHFPAEQIHIDLFDDIRNEPSELMNRICRFLELPSYSYPRATLSKIVNSSDDVIVDDQNIGKLRAECGQEADRLIATLSELPHIDISKVERWFGVS